MGAPTDIATQVARHLVSSNLASHDSHGVMRLAQYRAEANAGELRPAVRPELFRENGLCAIVDAGHGFGHFATMTAMNWCLESAPRMGIAAAAVRHSNHIGRLGEYAEQAAAQRMVGIVTVGMAGQGAGAMAPFGGRSRFLGTNPWAIGVPVHGRTPFVMDFATTTVAEGRVRLARAKRAQVAPGVILDRAGEPVTDPEQFYAGGTLTPLGGRLAGHKGYGLAMASALIGALAMVGDDDPTSAGNRSGEKTGWIAGVFTIAIDPEWFGGRDAYEALVRLVLDGADGAEPGPGAQRVLVPGEPAISRQRRLREGITIAEATWAELADASASLDVPMPESRPYP
jgi:LDH2 family malate/lactate/ureidoglycolate dehydrogenase